VVVNGRLRVGVAGLGLAFVLAIVLGATGVLAPKSQRVALGASTTLTIIAGPIFVRHLTGDFVPADDGVVLGTGDTVKTGALRHEGSASTTASLDFSAPPTAPGTYVVTYRVVARDGHPTTGSYNFVLRGRWHEVAGVGPCHRLVTSGVYRLSTANNARITVARTFSIRRHPWGVRESNACGASSSVFGAAGAARSARRVRAALRSSTSAGRSV